MGLISGWFSGHLVGVEWPWKMGPGRCLARSGAWMGESKVAEETPAAAEADLLIDQGACRSDLDLGDA